MLSRIFSAVEGHRPSVGSHIRRGTGERGLQQTSATGDSTATSYNDRRYFQFFVHFEFQFCREFRIQTIPFLGFSVDTGAMVTTTTTTEHMHEMTTRPTTTTTRWPEWTTSTTTTTSKLKSLSSSRSCLTFLYNDRESRF